MTEDYGLDIQDFFKVINAVSDYIIVDIRNEDVAKNEGLFQEAIRIEEHDIPVATDEIPSYFKSITLILVGDDPSVSSKWVNNFRQQDKNLNQLYYLNGTASDVFLADPRMKE